jgi:hypothetical protein
VSVLAEQFGTGQVFWSFLWFVMFFIWIWLLVVVFGDIFRSHDIGGGAKTLWVLFIIITPYLGVFVYLIARGGSMHERIAEQAMANDAMARKYIQSVAASPAEELAKLADLRAQGHITDDEYARLKAKVVDPSTTTSA